MSEHLVVCTGCDGMGCGMCNANVGRACPICDGAGVVRGSCGEEVECPTLKEDLALEKGDMDYDARR